LASTFWPLGQAGSQPIAGHVMPLGGDGAGPGGVQPPDGSMQLHWQAGHASPGGQAGQAQPHPIGGGGVAVWHTPETQVIPAMHGAPRPNHWHALSALHEPLSLWALQGSLPGELMLVVVLLVVPVGAGTGPLSAQLQAQGGQSAPGAQSGHAQVQVP
jgi:hypothetical protein